METARTASIFISYGRDDASDFVRRLSADLAARGYQVWTDVSGVESGGLFEVRIEQAIQSASIVGAVMTAHALRNESVCRDEIVYAVNAGKRIVPIRIDGDPALRPSLLLARRQWINFTQGYDDGLAALIRVLDGDDSALQPAILPTVAGVSPIDFASEVARHTTTMVGREWVFAEIDRSLSRSHACLIVGDPGIGKSAIAARLSEVRLDIGAVHFCSRDYDRSRDPLEFVATLVGQLSVRIPRFANALAAREPERIRHSANDAFRELVLEPMATVEQSCVVIIDGLDEALGWRGDGIVDIVARHIGRLPQTLRIVMASRPEPAVLRRFGAVPTLHVHSFERENIQDVIEYVTQRVSRGPLEAIVGSDRQRVINQTLALADGNFLVARCILDDLGSGLTSPGALPTMSPGMAAYYFDALRARFATSEAYNHHARPILRSLMVAREPVPFEIVVALGGGDAEAAQQVLEELGSLVRANTQDGVRRFTLFHLSFTEWLSDPAASGEYWCDPARGHAEMARVVGAVARGSAFDVSHRPTHLLKAADWPEAATCLTDLEFLESKTLRGDVHELVRDFNLAIELMPEGIPERDVVAALGEAIRVDVAFLKRNPDRLFQTLWNTCWWQDCAPLVDHVQAPSAVVTLTPGPVARLLERWRSRKAAVPGFAWARSCRPPRSFLGHGRRQTYRGHAYGIRALTCSPDGRTLASAGYSTVRTWDIETGAELTCIQAHDGAITGMAIHPHQDWLATCALDGTVRIWDMADGAKLRDVIAGDYGWGYHGHHTVGWSADGTWFFCGHGWGLDIFETHDWARTLDQGGANKRLHTVAVEMDEHIAVGGVGDLLASVDRRTGNRRWTSALKSTIALAYDRQRQLLFAGDYDGRVLIVNPTDGATLRELYNFDESVCALALTRNGDRLLMASQHMVIGLDVATGTIDFRHEVAARTDDRALGLLLSVAIWGPDDRTFIYGNEAADIDERYLTTRKTLQLLDDAQPFRDVVMSADGRTALTVSRTSLARWSTETGRISEKWEIEPNHHFACDEQLQRAVLAFDTEAVEVIDLASQRVLARLNNASRGCVTMTREGNRAATGDSAGQISVWEVENERMLWKGSCRDDDDENWYYARVVRLAFSFDGAWLVSLSLDGCRLWDAATGKFEGLVSAERATEIVEVPGRRYHLSVRGHDVVLERTTPPTIAIALPTALDVYSVDTSGMTISGLSRGSAGHLHLYRIEESDPGLERVK